MPTSAQIAKQRSRHRNPEVLMEPKPDDTGHAAVVDAWIKRSIGSGSPGEPGEFRSSPEIVGMFGAALEGLWSRAVTALGTVTLTAIAERVLTTAAGRYPFLSVIDAHPNGDTRWRQQARDRLGLIASPQLLEGARFGLIELLTVIGRLTAEILSEELHEVLLAVTAASVASSPDAQPTVLHVVPSIAIGKVQQ
jgi:hypothetical protein